ncbi:spore coat protein I [Paenibacillus lautus]|uniref:phosphotransferase n=1 Tax=Paenibacillus lautus TaxID=1401 RepID=UPI001B1BF504|nr:phosphotransferase [Paenibacillus lautus]GIO98816.1 spore coat protein I [Paenibacillus lautus]
MPTIQDATMVLNQYYDIKKPKIEWIQDEPDKAVWKVIDNKETYILKSDYRSSKTFTPSVTIQNALSQQGLKVPEVIATNQRKLCTKQGKHRYYLSRYISGGSASIMDRVKVIGDFHQHARLPSSLTSNQNPDDLKVGIKRWISEYQFKLKELMKWKDQYSLQHIQPCIQLAEKCIRVSSRRVPVLADHLKSVNNRRWLVHGDLTHLNAIKTASGDIWIIDLEHSRIDSPIKDIRYLLPRMVLSSHYKEYFARFPEGKSFEELYYIDAIFPYSLYYYLGGSIRQNKLPLKKSRVQEIVLDELKKDDILSRQLGGVK